MKFEGRVRAHWPLAPSPNFSSTIMETVGWLFDLYPLGDRMVLWFLTPEGEALRQEDAFPYLVYVGGSQGQVRRAVQALQAQRWLQHAYPTRGRDLVSGEEIPGGALGLQS